MSVKIDERFDSQDIYIDYDFEEVMFRWDHKNKVAYKRFYNEEETGIAVERNNRLFTDALQDGEEISKEMYEQGKPVNNDAS